MDADDHREVRELLGSFALGALTADEELRVRAHLDGCPACRALLDELGTVAAALPAVDPAALAAAPPTPDVPGLGALLDRVARDDLGRRRRARAVTATGGLAAVAAAAALALAIVTGGEPADRVAPQAPARALGSASAGVTGTVRVLDRDWGTQLTLEARGLPADRRLVVWLERPDGRRVPAGTITGIGDRILRAELAASVRPRDAVGVGVSEAGGRELLRGPL